MADEDETNDGEMKTSSSLQQMLASIAEERCKDTQLTNSGEFEIVSTDVKDFWTSLFSKYFLEGALTSEEIRDDMLFYVRKTQDTKRKFYLKSEIEVYRKDSKLKPSLEDKTICWEETVYLNIILHQFEYKVTCALCTRTGEKHLEILKKFTQRVYPSPSRRRMDSKGTEEEMTYPNIFFMVDNFEELSLTSKMVQTMSLGFIKGHKRIEFVRMRGPHSKGHAEMAVSRVKGSGPETPDIENFPVDDFDNQQQEQNEYKQRRMSDPSSSVASFVRGGIRRLSMKKSQSETERVGGEVDVDGCPEVEAGTLQDELNSNEHYNGFLGAFGQAWHLFKERRRATSVALNSYLTYVTLPWHWIIADVLDSKQQPVLQF
ncbi:hypothetical protein KUTeg_023797 [Tegillarca granosa]|uniref:Uncharacterized protein n=1 Tax=Tegillarca granosa TaxID=220873 RepID=A0ABQ9E383_TEGGR|nr:hypothetical protein KUTeg_023797 [Tegillarca granosa]